ncbi:hypothetical protein [Nocardioides sp. NPDC006303]|uniref:hypothetical protein n=1 Tax=Nocardioides sp. NPDC006303 TaxID=3156747 RepID=UPI0033A6BE3E
MDKRANEWSILRTVYDIEECAGVDESERPDFLLSKDGHGAVPFGVEVTELFRHEADARSVRHPDYLDALFRGGPYMHKDDKKPFALSWARITDKDGAVKAENVPVIVTPPIPEADHRRAIATTIRSKGSRGYAVEDGHVDLIIRDRYFPSGEPLPDDYSVTALLSDGVRQALIDSPFREVHLISISRARKQVIRPLIQLMLTERLFLFGKAVEGALGRQGMDEQWKYVQAFAEYMEREGLALDLLDFDGLPVAAYRSSAVGLGRDWGLEIFDLADRQAGLRSWERRPLSALTDDEVAACSQFVSDGEFSWGHYGNPIEPADLEFPKTRSVQVVEVPRDELP